MRFLIFFFSCLVSINVNAQLSIAHHEPPDSIESKTEYEFKVKYSSDRDLRIYFEFKRKPDQSFGFKNLAATSGTDKILSVPITASSLPPQGEDYFIRTYFVENNKIVDGTVTDVEGIKVFINVVDDALQLEMPPTTLFSQTQYNFEVNYQATESRDLIFELWSGDSKIGSASKEISGGSTTTDITLNLDEDPPLGDDYSIKAYLVPVGEEVSNAVATTDEFSNISMVDYLGETCAEEFEEKDGLLIIEAENFDIGTSRWERKTDKPGYTGISYLEWTGNDSFNSASSTSLSKISAKIKINKAGKYRFSWRNRIGFGSNTTEHNDTWLRFPDASDFYGEKPDGSRTYPKGSGKSPNPEGAPWNAPFDGWFKVYANNLSWNNSANTGDNADGRPVYVEFEEPGVYTLELSGRSKNHQIDRIILSNNGTDALNPATPASLCSNLVNNTAETSLSSLGIKVFPIPTKDRLFIEGLEISDQLEIWDMMGRRVIYKVAISNELDLSHLPKGFYVLRIAKKGRQPIIIH